MVKTMANLESSIRGKMRDSGVWEVTLTENPHRHRLNMNFTQKGHSQTSYTRSTLNKIAKSFPFVLATKLTPITPPSPELAANLKRRCKCTAKVIQYKHNSW